MGGMVASFLRVLLLPVICVGVPAWPIVGILCAVPLVGIFAIPLFLFLTLLLLYSVAWFSYLLLAQADPPASSQQGALSPYLPFLPYSPMRCLKINWAALMYASSAVKVAVPAVLDWSYRRVMVLGTQGGGGIVKWVEMKCGSWLGSSLIFYFFLCRENILYGSPFPNKRLDVYLPPSPAAGMARGPPQTAMGTSMRHRKHSTHFAEPAAAADEDADATPRPDSGLDSANRQTVPRAPVVVVVPSPIPPFTWTQKRKTYLQLALRLRRMGYCVVVPDLTWYPEGRVNASIVDLRLVLRWVSDNCKRYGGDERQIFVLGHGMSAHLAMLALTQEAVVLSREGFLQRESKVQAKREMVVNWDSDGDETILTSSAGQLNGSRGEKEEKGMSTNGTYAAAAASAIAPSENAWVDEPGEEEILPGSVMTGDETLDSITTRRARGLSALNSMHGATGSSNIAFPSTASDGRGLPDDATNGAGHNNSSSPTTISNGLRRVEIYEPEIAVPPVAGVILLAGVYDVIKCFRNESDRGVEHLSLLRRSCGPSHTACLLHSPAHLLYAAKNILDTSLLPPRFLLVHGGKDAVVDISQSTLLKTLLSGIGVENVKLRAYRELGHVEAVASLFLGMGKASTRYSKQILNDINDFITL